GVLTVTSGSDTVKLDFNGSYALANFSFASDGSGGTIVYDPPVPSFDTAASTQSASSYESGNNHMNQVFSSTTDSRPGNLALLANYIASSFPTGGTGSDHPIIPAAAWESTHQSPLTNPHHT
ncbi:MAG: hypothetical protein ACRETA_12825, partial [Gammaproteobacteria bacterium]